MATVGILLIGFGITVVATMAYQGLSPQDAWVEVKQTLKLP